MIRLASKRLLPFEYFKDRVPAKDAVGVAKLKEAGAIIIGKMNMHQLGIGTTALISYYGAIHNPWNSEYIAGGSSGGSAAAVAKRHVLRDTRYPRHRFLPPCLPHAAV